MVPRILGVLALAAVIAANPPVHAAPAGGPSTDRPPPDGKVTLAFDHALPNAPGKSIKSVIVDYPPGGATPAHTHAKSAFIYAVVLQGAIRSQVNDGPEKTYRTGESFFELPGDLHAVSANASKTHPARLLAVFIVDTNETVLTTVVKK
jgi:quercetin dioxygenase-like cupin family protein